MGAGAMVVGGLAWVAGLVAQGEVASNAAPGPGYGQVRCIGVDVEPHVASHITNGGIRVCVGII